MAHQPTVTKNIKNTQSKFDSFPWTCDVAVAPRSVRLSSSPGTQLLLLPKGNSKVPLFSHFLNYPPYVCKPSKNCNPAALTVDPMLLPLGNPFKCHVRGLYLQSMIPTKRFDIFPDWGMPEGLDAFRFFF